MSSLNKQNITLTFIIFACLIAFSACTKHARLYPVNDIAAKLGILTATYVDSGTGGGVVTVTMPDGEVLKGEYTTVDTSSIGFGNVITSVYGTGISTSGSSIGTAFGSAFGTGTSTFVGVPGSSPGIVSLYGNRGTTMQCEYFVNSFSGKGGGACKSSNGALYRLHFGAAVDAGTANQSPEAIIQEKRKKETIPYKNVVNAPGDSIEELPIEKEKEFFSLKLKSLKKEEGDVGVVASLLLMRMDYNKGNNQYLKGINKTKKVNNDFIVSSDIFVAENIFELLANDVEKITTDDSDIQEVVYSLKKSILFRTEGIKKHNQGYYVTEEDYNGEFEKGAAKIKIADNFFLEALKGLQQLMKKYRNYFSESEVKLLSNNINYYSPESIAPSPITPQKNFIDSTPETKKWQSTTEWRARPCELIQHEVSVTLIENYTIQGILIECSNDSIEVLSESESTRSIRRIYLKNIKALLWR